MIAEIEAKPMADDDRAAFARSGEVEAAAAKPTTTQNAAIFDRHAPDADPAVTGATIEMPESDLAPAVCPTVIAVASGKGGVGKTNIAIGVAAALAKTGRRVTLIDGDLGLANADVLCGLRPTAHLGHVIAGQRTIEDVAIDAPGGFRLVPGGAGIARLTELSTYERSLVIDSFVRLEQDADAIVVDCGAGIGQIVRGFLAASDAAVVVTTPEPTAITDAYSLIKCIAATGGTRDGNDRQRPDRAGPPAEVSLLVNQVNNAEEAHAVHRRMASVAQRFLNVDVPLAGHVRFDREVQLAVRSRTPFPVHAPKSPASRDICRVTAGLAERAFVAQPKRRGGFFRRVLHAVRPAAASV
jgi:flagellar biosynthesis protein FlhG